MISAEKICERSRIIKILVRAQNSVIYPIIFAALCVCSGLNDKSVYLPIIWILCGFVIFSALFSPDNKVFLVPMLMVYYSLGRDGEHVLYDDLKMEYLQSFDPDAFVQICVCGVIMASAFIIRLIADGSVTRAFKKRGICTWGIISLDVVLILNGIFSENYSPMNLIYGVLMSLCLTVFYFITLSMLENSENIIPYACKCLVCTSYVALCQILVLCWRVYQDGNLFLYGQESEIIGINRGWLAMSWGVPTIVGAVIVIGIPAAMYLARNCKFSFVGYFSAALFLLGAIIIDTRSAIIVGGLVFVLSVIICCIGGKNKRKNRIYTAILSVLAIGALIYINARIMPISAFLDKVFEILRLDAFAGEARYKIFENGINDFKASPIFGVGFSDGGYADDMHRNNVYSNMYHCIAVQLIASMGIVGVIGFLVHIKQVGEIAVRRFSVNKLFLILVPLMILAMSMVDNFFFYPNFQILYSAFLALAEIYLEQSRRESLSEYKRAEKNKKPRVAFTYVEAGKGHIVPETAVHKSFEAKYGDKVEIVESRFYSETNDPKMKKTESLFEKTVKNQNKSPLIGFLCRVGSFVFGDSWSLSWVMACTPSGIASCKRAKKHLSELDCDVLFTTHWSVAYYASHIKNAPYTVMLCPDPYSNGMFNVDVNKFLITSEVGKKQVEGRRMYAGGDITAVPHPMRSCAVEHLGKRDELREKHGISKDSFTVALLDGGYGMAKLEKSIKHIMKSDANITIIAFCGTNTELQKKLELIETPSNIKLIPLGYCEDVFEYIAMADLFCGKSGANALAEAAYCGIPIMITRCITYIEKDTRKYHTKTVKGAMYVPSARAAAKKITEFAKERSLLAPYAENISKLKGISGEEMIADMLYEATQIK